MVLGTARACLWHEPLLLLATCCNKFANDNQKPHCSFLIKLFKNIKNTHDLNFLKSHTEVIFQKQRSTNFGSQKIGARCVLGCHLVCSLRQERNLGLRGVRRLSYSHVQFPRSSKFVSFIRALIKASVRF